MSTKAVAERKTFSVDMPDNAPALGFDPEEAGFSWRDVMPSAYMSLDWLEDTIAARGGNPVVTPARIVIQPVIDPEAAEPDLSPKIVMEFVENVPALVFNKTRCTLAQTLTNTPDPRRWAELLPPVEIYAGAQREFSAAMQILFRPVAAPDPREAERKSRVNRPKLPADYSTDDVNDDLFD